MAYENTTRVLACAVDDCGLVVLAQVPGHEQPYDARLLVHHRTGIAAHVGAVIPYYLLLAPRLATIPGALDQHVDVARVSAALHPTLAESQARALARNQQGRDPVGVVAVTSAYIERLHVLAFC